MYETINYALVNYFSMVVECCSYEEGISALRQDISNDPLLANDLKIELQNALNDQDYSWKDTFIEHQCEILFTHDQTEEEVRAYVKKKFWDELFTA